tara:strand:- start:7477 stop:7938 length:462 start_codon:yes stop_codon:yes gene_type:complete
MKTVEMLQFLYDKKILIKEGNRYVVSKTAEPFINTSGSKTIKTSTVDISDLATKIRNMYPTGVRSGGFYVKSPQADVEKKLKVFLKTYPEYTPDDIKTAVSNYVFNCSQTDYRYMKLLGYFIMKDGQSMLAAHIENLEAAEERELQDFKGDAV